MPQRRVPVLILGRDVTALGVMRSLGRAGISAYCTCGADDFAASSRWAHCIPNTLQDTSTVQELTAFLQALPFERVVLMPCSDWWAQKVARLDPALSDRFRYVGSPTDTVDRIVDKLEFARLAHAHGIPHPHTVAADPADIASLPASGETEYFIKARDSQAFTMLLGIKASQVVSLDETRRLLARARAVDQHVVLQEYLPGPATNHYFVDGFVDPHGNVRARFCRQRLRMNPWPFGNSTSLRSIALSDVPDIVDTVDRLVSVAGIRGIFSIELKRDARDGIAKVLDVNLRPWWYVEFAASCGVNVCEMAYLAALGESVAPAVDYPVNRTCVFPFHDLGACVKLWRTGELTSGAWARSWLSSKHTILSLHDPHPYVHFYSAMARDYARRGARRLNRLAHRRVQDLWSAEVPARANGA